MCLRNEIKAIGKQHPPRHQFPHRPGDAGVWENAPLPSGELVTRCNEELGWKKPTTYTVLRNLCQAGIFENKQAVVSVLVSEEDYLARESEQIVNERFGGSISHFVTAFATKTKLDKEQIQALQDFIDHCEE